MLRLDEPPQGTLADFEGVGMTAMSALIRRWVEAGDGRNVGDLARKVHGLSRQVIYNYANPEWTSKQMPAVETIRAIASALGVRPERVLVAFARDLGLWSSPAGGAFVQDLPAGVGELPPKVQATLLDLIRALLDPADVYASEEEEGGEPPWVTSPQDPGMSEVLAEPEPKKSARPPRRTRSSSH